MNTEHDSLEAELAALSPNEVSADLTQRIAERLESEPAGAPPEPSAARRRTARWRWIAVAAAVAVAASVAVALLLPRIGNRAVVESPEAGPESTVASAFDATLPSLWQFRQALQGSPHDLDAVLDKHTTHITKPNPERSASVPAGFARVYVFSRFDSKLDSLGEL